MEVNVGLDYRGIKERWRTISSLVETVRRVAMRGENGHLVAQVLEADCGVNDQSLSTTDTKIGVEEDDAFPGGLGMGVSVTRL